VDNDQLLKVTGLTGIDLNLSIAGPGTRSYAFLIDWHIRLLLALAWLCGVLVVVRIWGLQDAHVFKGAGSLLSAVPPLAIYFLYHPILELAMRGRTPGKRMAGVRLVNLNGGQPGTAALLIRNVFRLFDCLPAFYVVGLLCCLFTRHRVRIGDMAAGTILVLDDARAPKMLARLSALSADNQIDPRLIELASELLERWPSLAAGQRATLARSLLARAHPGDPADAFAALGEFDLQQRLRQLLPAAA
jgi:uncharacterized RDD family membrane protein YckC